MVVVNFFNLIFFWCLLEMLSKFMFVTFRVFQILLLYNFGKHNNVYFCKCIEQ